MTHLTRLDRMFVTAARLLERPTLGLVSSQPLLRRLFAISAAIGGKMAAGTVTHESENGVLTITPPGIAPDAPLLVYLHGGGFTLGSPRTHMAMVSHLAKAAGMRARAYPYRLAPEHPFPAAKLDCIAAYEALCVDGDVPAALCGDSAGGCLALQVAVHARDTGLPLPKALGLIGPVADLSGDVAARFAAAPGEILIPGAWARRILDSYLPGIDPKDPAVSPLLGDLSGLPPMMLQAGAEEAAVADAIRLKAAMEHVTLDLWPGLQHVWHIHAGRMPAADHAIARLGAYLAEHARAGAPR